MLSSKWDIYIAFLSAQTQGSLLEKVWEDFKCWRCWIMARKHFLDAPGQLHIWSDSDRDYLHKTCVSSRQKKFQCGGGNKGTTSHHKLGSYWHLTEAGKGKVCFLYKCSPRYVTMFHWKVTHLRLYGKHKWTWWVKKGEREVRWLWKRRWIWEGLLE